MSPRDTEIYTDELPPAHRKEKAVPVHSQFGQRQTLICTSPDLSPGGSQIQPNPNACSYRVRGPRVTYMFSD